MCARTIGAREPRADFKFYVVKFWTFYEGFESPPGKSFAQNYVTIWAKFDQINQRNLGGLLTKLLPGATLAAHCLLERVAHPRDATGRS